MMRKEKQRKMRAELLVYVLKVINEPTAAALAYGLANREQKQNVMVYDLGGGTFDVTLIQLNQDEVVVKATGRS